MDTFVVPIAVLLGVAVGSALRMSSRRGYAVLLLLVIAGALGWWLYGRTLQENSEATSLWGTATSAFMSAIVAGLVVAVWHARRGESSRRNREAVEPPRSSVD